MKTNLLLSLAIFLLNCSYAIAQDKKVIDHTAYNQWKSIRGSQINNNASLVTYEINPQVGDGFLYIYHIEGGVLDSIPRGYNASFSGINKYVVFLIKPEHSKIRQAKIDKKKESEFPTDTLAIYKVSDKKIIKKIPQVKKFVACEESPMIALLHSADKKVASKENICAHKGKCSCKKKKKKKKKETIKPPVIKSDGFIFELITDPEEKLPEVINKKSTEKFVSKNKSWNYITDFSYSKYGDIVTLIQQFKSDKTDSSYIIACSKNVEPKTIFSCKGFCKTIENDEQGKQTVFLSSSDTTTKKVYDLFYWNTGNSQASKIIEITSDGIPAGWCVSEYTKLSFNPKGTRVFFGTAKKPDPEIKDTLPDDEKYKLDLWSWSDVRIMPEQLKNLSADQIKNYDAVYHIAKNKMVQLCDSTMDQIQYSLQGDGLFALGKNDLPYEKMKSWDVMYGSDYYVINLETGARKEILKNHKYACRLSTSGNYVAYYLRKENQWFALEHQSEKKLSLTEKINAVFYEDDNGNPSEEDAIGIMGWEENDAAIYVYGEYDIYRIDPTNTSGAKNITNGKDQKIVYRYVNYDREDLFIPKDSIPLHHFNSINKKAGFSVYANGKVSQLIESDHKYTFYSKAKNKNALLYSKMSFRDYPELQLSSTHFKSSQQLSVTNPQQSNYLWGTVELVHWKSPKGRQLDGLLYKPENFDSRKKYPLLVYFYEKYADDIHNYYSPRPSASIINPTEYASVGYVVFIPDILYNEGTPGDDAYDCIVSGTDYMVSLGFIDSTKMGLQGQSWGGYQTAYLVTRTNKYAAAMAGAPVSNMTSAYGGIRWGSGLSRAFQYEKTQSRLGATLWENRERYIYNSPVFFADKVNTPLLIMHNDEDGAVPWYQGIEYFSALRRLNKKVWMLNYNGDDHNLRKWANKMDLSIRMRQFFDHYLLDQPMPEWMKNGIPAIEKGKKTGYELLKD